MLYNAYITSGKLKPIKVKITNPLATGIRIIAGLFIICGMVISFITLNFWIIPIVVFAGLIIDSFAEIMIMLNKLLCQEYILKDVTMQIETDEDVPVTIQGIPTVDVDSIRGTVNANLTKISVKSNQ